MQYDIEPLNISRSNVLGRTLAKSSGDRLMGIEKGALEKTLQSMPSSNGFHLKAKLTIPLKAKVLRNLESSRQVVRLSSSGIHVDLFRDVADQPGDIGVSCSPHGDEVPVETLNIKFRDYDDDWTDRGIVWVYLGNPATMGFFVKAQALKTSGVVTEIITAAEEAVKDKVLVHFN